jgi:hypothetical protein
MHNFHFVRGRPTGWEARAVDCFALNAAQQEFAKQKGLGPDQIG